jgi:hypothetical protein
VGMQLDAPLADFLQFSDSLFPPVYA